jgi:hypothetical protein
MPPYESPRTVVTKLETLKKYHFVGYVESTKRYYIIHDESDRTVNDRYNITRNYREINFNEIQQYSNKVYYISASQLISRIYCLYFGIEYINHTCRQYMICNDNPNGPLLNLENICTSCIRQAQHRRNTEERLNRNRTPYNNNNFTQFDIEGLGLQEIRNGNYYQRHRTQHRPDAEERIHRSSQEILDDIDRLLNRDYRSSTYSNSYQQDLDEIDQEILDSVIKSSITPEIKFQIDIKKLIELFKCKYLEVDVNYNFVPLDNEYKYDITITENDIPEAEQVRCGVCLVDITGVDIDENNVVAPCPTCRGSSGLLHKDCYGQCIQHNTLTCITCRSNYLKGDLNQITREIISEHYVQLLK